MMTDAKHAHAKRAREREGVIPRKRPRVSGARKPEKGYAPSTHFARSARCVASYSLARGNSKGNLSPSIYEPLFKSFHQGLR